MAFGNGDDDIDITVRVDAQGAVQVLDQFGQKVEQTEHATQSAAQGFSKFQATIVTLNQAVGLAQQAFGLVGNAIGAAVAAIERGSVVGDVATNFGRLAERAGVAADVLVRDLQQATAGTISQFELMRSANQALNAGLRPDEITELATAARALSKEIGGDLQQNYNRLIEAFQKGETEQLKTLGIIIDNKEAQSKFAAQLGVTREELNKQGQVAAVQQAALEQLRQRTAEVGEMSEDAGDSIQQLRVAFSDLYDRIATELGTNEELNAGFKELSEVVRNIDFGPMISGIGSIASALGEAITKIDDFALGIRAIAEQAKIFGPLRALIDQEFGAAIVAASERSRAALREFNRQYSELQSSIRNAESAEQFKAIGQQIQFLVERLTKANVPFQQIQDRVADLYRRLNEANESFANTGQSLANLQPRVATGSESFTKAAAAAAKLTEEQQKLAAQAAFLSSPQGIKKLAGEVDQLIAVYREGLIDISRLSIATETLREEFIKGGGSAEDFARTLDNRLGRALDDIGGKLEKAGETAASAFGEGFTEALAENLAGSFGSIADALVSGGDIGGAFADLGNSLGGVLGQELGNGVAQSLGASAGGFLGSIAGPIGSALGSLGGQALFDGIASLFSSKDSPGTAARKSADKYFADLFDANRLGVIIEDQLVEIRDLVFRGNTLFGGQVDFADGTFSQFFQTLPAQARESFAGVGAAFEQLLGVSGDIAGQIGAVLANNIGGSLNNLQLLVKTTGVSFEELRGAVLSAFEQGEISALEAQSALQGIATIAEDGIPGAFGAVQEAFENTFAAGSKGGLAVLDGLQDIGFEARELGLSTLPEIQQLLEQTGSSSAEQIAAVFSALERAGITSIDQLVSATTEQLLPVLADLESRGLLKETTRQAEELLDRVENLPSEIRTRVRIDVEVNDPRNGFALIQNGQGVATR